MVSSLLHSHLEGMPRGTRFEDQRAVSDAEVLVAQAVEAAVVKRGLERVRSAPPGDVQPAAEIARALIRQAEFLDELVNSQRAIQPLRVHPTFRSRHFDLTVGVLDNQGINERFDFPFTFLDLSLRLRFRPIRQIEEIERRQTRQNGELNRHQTFAHSATVRRFHGPPLSRNFHY